ncbi:hypothetical protein ACJJTC_018595, partial [Scirpophaga incertulas]
LARRASRTSRSENSRAGNPRLICIPVTGNGPRAWAGSPRARASPPAGRCVLKHATGARSALKDSYWLHTNHRVLFNTNLAGSTGGTRRCERVLALKIYCRSHAHAIGDTRRCERGLS